MDITHPTRVTEDLRDALTAALAVGMTHGEIAQVVVGTMADAEELERQFPGFEPDNLPVFSELPEGMIDLPSARKRYGCSRSKISNWVKKGQLQVVGRLRAPAPGGGYLVVLQMDLERKLETSPTKRGRPRKNS